MEDKKKHPNWGGQRERAGRPSKWGVETTTIRVPKSMVDEIKAYIDKRMKKEA